jgi:hypothetical protein
MSRVTNHVSVPPTVSISGEEAIRPIGDQIVMFCQAAGNPQPTLHWLKVRSNVRSTGLTAVRSQDDQLLVTSAEGARITSDGGRLDIPRLRATDIGQYKCVAKNEAGVAEAMVFVDVLGSRYS